MKDRNKTKAQLLKDLEILPTREKSEINEEQDSWLVKLLPVAVIVLCKDKIILVNDAGIKLVEAQSAEELIGNSFLKFVYPEHRDLVSQELREGLKKNVTITLIDKKFIRLDNKVIDVEIIATPFRYENKPAMLTMVRDISRRVQAERSLKESEERLEFAVKGTGAGLWDWMIQTDEMVYNKGWAEIIGYNLDEISPIDSKTFEKYCHPDDLKRSNKLLGKHLKGESEYYECELRKKHKKGNWIWVLDKGKIVEWDNEGKPVRMSGIHLDITARKLAESQIKKDLREKEVMLKEIHHRVKNNLNLIKSLLNLQAKTIKTKKQALESFKESRDRVFTMALVHESMYKAEDFTKVDMASYISDLSREIVRLHHNGKRIFLKVKVENVFLDINTAIPCGLIINELITNAIKYAFSNTGKGEIRINLKNHKDNKYELSIQDNGMGIPDKSENQYPDSFGLKLVNLLIKQINGKIKVSCNKGSHFKIIFPRAHID